MYVDQRSALDSLVIQKSFTPTMEKGFIATVNVDLMMANNPNCFIITGHPRTPCDKDTLESANEIVQQVLSDISNECKLQGLDTNWTKIFDQVMFVCNSHSGRRKYSRFAYETVFGHKYHSQIKCNMSEIRQCWSIFNA